MIRYVAAGMVILVLIGGGLFLIFRSDEEPVPDDPLPNVRAGLTALNAGDLGGVDAYFCDEILISMRREANKNALNRGSIDLQNAQFTVINKQGEHNWTVSMTGEWTLTGEGGLTETHKSGEEGAIYFGVQVEDGVWKICAIEPENSSPSGTQ